MEPSQVHRSIQAVLDDQARAWNEGNIEKYMSGYDRSDRLRFASGADVVYGWQVARERYEKRYPNQAAMGVLTFSGIDVKTICPDAALVFGQWALERKGDHLRGLFTLLFRETDAGWRIVHDHTSSAEVLPGPRRDSIERP